MILLISFVKHFLLWASEKLKRLYKVIQGYRNIVFLITLYNLFSYVSRETIKSPFLRKGQARLRAGDRTMKKSCWTSRLRWTPTSLCVLFHVSRQCELSPLPPFQRKRVSARTFSAGVMFHVKHRNTGYNSADFCCETFPAIASDKVKRVIQGYRNIVFLITLYNPFSYVSRETIKSPFLRKGQARLRAGDRPMKKSCWTSRLRWTPTSLCVSYHLYR